MSVVLFHSVFQDLEAWYQDIQSRLQLIPDPSYKLKYTPTCTAIQQLQVYNRPTAKPLMVFLHGDRLPANSLY